jgi:hypothetical protein
LSINELGAGVGPPPNSFSINELVVFIIFTDSLSHSKERHYH